MGLIGYSLRSVLGARRFWSLLLIVFMAVNIGFYQVVEPLASGVSEQLEAYTEFGAGFITIYVPYFVGCSLDNPYHLELNNSSPSYHLTEERLKQAVEDHLESYPFDMDDMEAISAIGGVEKVYKLPVYGCGYPPTAEQIEQEYERSAIPRLEGYTMTTFGIDLHGIDPEVMHSGLLPFIDLEEGRYFTSDKPEIVVNTKIRDYLSYGVNSEIPLIFNNGTLSLPIVGVSRDYITPWSSDIYLVFLSLDHICELFDVSPEELRSNILLVKLDEANATLSRGVVRELRGMYPDAKIHYAYAQSDYLRDTYTASLASLDALRNTVLAFTGLAVVAVRFVDLLRGRRMLGLYTAVGWRERDMVAYFLGQSLGVGVLGTLVGVALAWGFGGYLSGVLIPRSVSYTVKAPMIPDVRFIPYALVLAVALSVVSFTAGYLFYRRLTPLQMIEKR